MHGRRQFVLRSILLSQATSETHANSCQHVLRDGGDTVGTASAKEEEGMGNGRSACPELSGLHAGYNGQDNGYQHRKVKAIS